jgi:hypothetical protein
MPSSKVNTTNAWVRSTAVASKASETTTTSTVR